MSAAPVTLEMQSCWREIGVWGDRSCQELKQQIHCNNCPVFSSAGRNLLERELSPDYLEEWTELISSKQPLVSSYQAGSSTLISVGIFRIESEWLALPSALLKEVTQASPTHRVPHRNRDVLIGLVNIRGEIQMCVSLAKLLGLDGSDSPASQNMTHVVYPRLMVVEKEKSVFVFPVDEIHGIHRIHPRDIQNTPTTVAKRAENYTKGILFWQGKRVGYLDDDLLFYTLTRRVQ